MIICSDEKFWTTQPAFIAPQLILLASLFYCVKSLAFWKDLSCAIVTALNFEISFTVCEILLGLHLQTNPKIKCINYLILLGKWFLNNKNTSKCPIFVKEYMHFVRTKLEVLYLVHQKQRNL